MLQTLYLWSIESILEINLSLTEAVTMGDIAEDLQMNITSHVIITLKGKFKYHSDRHEKCSDWKLFGNPVDIDVIQWEFLDMKYS